MNAFPCPDYDGGSLVNLMSSLGAACGAPDSLYPPLRLLDSAELARARKLVLLVIDGLGYDYLSRQPAAGHLRRHLRGRMDSVFPTTTAAAITSLMTGVAPQQHGITGWFMWLREIGRLATILPFRDRLDGTDLADAGFDVAPLIGAPPFFSGLAHASTVLSPEWIVDSVFSRATCGHARRQGYRDQQDFFAQLTDLVKTGAARFNYAYWPEYDALAHAHGVSSAQVEQQFAELDAAFGRFLEQIAGTGACVVVTADHGFIDTGPAHYLHLADHPELAACLARPLCGEPRAAYCYVKPERAADFEQYVAERLPAYCECRPSRALIEAGYFGRGAVHPELPARIGDYTLLMKDQYVIKDYVEGERPFFFAGVHSGLSEAELRVPLIVAEA